MRSFSIFVLYLMLLGFFGGCTQSGQKSTSVQPTETDKMKAELKAISEEENINLWHRNKERAVFIDQKLGSISDPGQRITMLVKSAIEWLNAGDYNLSIERLSEINTFLESSNNKLPLAQQIKLNELLGIAYLRKGEIENCLNNHTEFSCIVPIQKEGQHKIRDGAENAKRIFEGLLKLDPENHQLDWLYAISEMTLGEFSENNSVGRIKPSLFASDVDFPRFVDKAMGLGIAVNDISGSVVMDDFNNDNYLDLLVTSYGLDDQIKYFENDRKGGFLDRTGVAGLDGILSGLNMVQADYNNDGYVDVLVLRGAWLSKDGNHPNSLLKNNGDGTFSDVTKSSGLYSLFPTQSASWADYNNDGWVDLFIANEHSNSMSASAQLYENNKDGTFKEVAKDKGIDLQVFSKGCVWTDFDNDGDMDIYVSVINGKNYLYRNNGEEKNYTFSEVGERSGVSGILKSFPTWAFDYNQDGYEDIFVSGFDFGQFESAAGEVARDYLGQEVSAEKPRLYRNNRDGSFTDVSKETNVDKVLFTMGCNFGDLNNDGFLDFYAATGTPDFRAIIPNRMFLNNGGEGFLDVTTNGGFGHIQKGHGVAFGDLDNDGDQDIYNVLGGSYDGDNFMNAMFENPGFDGNNITLKLIGTKSNKSAIGARVTVVASNSNGEERTFYNRVNSGGSFGANPLRIEQGLGEYINVKEISVIWPGTNKEVIYRNMEAGQFYEITQSNDSPKELNLKAVEFKSGDHNHHH